MRRNWKHVIPATLIQAFRLCKDHAKEKRNLSVERIAELMGVTADALYKWLGTGRMPANLIPPFELVCGIGLVSRHLASAGGRLVVDIPTGRLVNATDVQELQTLLTTAVSGVLSFAARTAEAPEVIADIEAGMGALAWHRGNIQKSEQPELELDA